MNVPLIDLLEEQGVRAIVMHHLRATLGLPLDTYDRCNCDQRTLALSWRGPHGRRCRLWDVARTFGLVAELVERDHGDALLLQAYPNSLIHQFKVGARWREQKLRRLDFEMGAYGERERARVIQAHREIKAADDAATARANGDPVMEVT